MNIVCRLSNEILCVSFSVFWDTVTLLVASDPTFWHICGALFVHCFMLFPPSVSFQNLCCPFCSSFSVCYSFCHLYVLEVSSPGMPLPYVEEDLIRGEHQLSSMWLTEAFNQLTADSRAICKVWWDSAGLCAVNFCMSSLSVVFLPFLLWKTSATLFPVMQGCSKANACVLVTS